MVYPAFSQIAVVALAHFVNAAPAPAPAPVEPYIALNDSAAANISPSELPPVNYTTGLPASNATYTKPSGGVATATIAPYTPAGGIETSNTSVPYFHPLSDFDYESFKLVVYQGGHEVLQFNID